MPYFVPIGLIFERFKEAEMEIFTMAVLNS